jgi:hypothetical protein
VSEIRIYGRVPKDYSTQGTPYGSNLEIYRDIINELSEKEDSVEELHLALYLFNNMHLLKKLIELASKGVKVIVTSLPLAGYDKRKVNSAQQVYADALLSGSLDLLIFPHMYVWYGAEYAGGGASYSFHVKAGFIKYKDGTAKAFLTSGNLAPGDPTHSEVALFIESDNQPPYIKPFELFFAQIEQRAKPYKDYRLRVSGLAEKLQQVFDFAFIGGTNPVNYNSDEASYAFFTSPFISIEGMGSNHYARHRIVRAINSAKRRVLVCAQHVHDIAPFDNFTGDTLIKALKEVKTSRPNMDVKVLKQVSSAGLKDKRRAAFVEAHLEYAGVEQRENKLVHDKFVIADDTLIVTTGNLTATQFGWGEIRMEFKTGISDLATVEKSIKSANLFFGNSPEKVRCMSIRKRKKGMSEVKVVKTDVFSEVNGFVEIRDAGLADDLEGYFYKLWNHRLSSDVEIPI